MKTKKLLSLLMAVIMVLTILPLNAFALDSKALGEFSLTIKQVYEIAATDFNVHLGGAQDFDGTLSMVTGRGNYGSVSFSGIPEGRYTLTVDGGSFLEYTQELYFEDNCINLELFTEGSVNDSIAEDQQKFGVIAIGDVNNDGKINDADANLVIDNIGTANLEYDLNGNGEVDIHDLAYVVRNGEGNVEAVPFVTVSSLKILEQAVAEVPETTEATVSGGDISVAEAVLSPSSDTFVALAPADASAEITEENPVTLALNVEDAASEEQAVSADAVVIAPPSGSENVITDGTVTIEAVDLDTGDTINIKAAITETLVAQAPRMLSGSAGATVQTTKAQEVTVESDGSIVINIGKRVAVKKVTINVTGTSSGKLAEIARVEFLGDFAERIPEPKLSIPTIDESSIRNTGGEDKSLTFSWDAQVNVSYYEVSISGSGLNVSRTTEATTFTFQSDSFNGRLQAFKTYTLKVRSVSGDWKSDWSKPVNYTIDTTDKPPRPEYLSVKSAVLSLDVSWRALYDTQYYSLFYREVGTEAYTEIKNITSASLHLSGLRAEREYEIYVVAHNKNGSSAPSAHATGVVLTATGVEMPYYNLINTKDANGKMMTHISSINGVKSKSYRIYKSDGTSVNNTNATAADWEAIADNDPASYMVIDDWDSGVTYANFRGPIVQLDGRYKIDTIRMAPSPTASAHINAVVIGYRAENGSIQRISTSFNTRYDSLNRRYYEVVFQKPVTTDYLEIRTTTGYARQISISELRLYYYDSLMDDVNALFTDDTQIALVEGVTQATIDELKNRAEKIDEATGEYNPKKDAALVTLAHAQDLLNNPGLDEPIKIDTGITAAADGNLGFAMTLSPNQPIGYVASAGDTVIIYVGSKTEARGAKTSLMLTVSQYHPEVSSWSKDVKQLVVGRNEIQIPAITSVAKEKGGSLYIWYGSSANAKTYNVRVQGGTKIPMLNVSKIYGAERTAAIEKYVSELAEYVTKIETMHNDIHTQNNNTNYDYNVKECVLNSTEIVMDNMFYSFPATQVYGAIKGAADPADRLEKAIAGMEYEVDLFYQFKGLNKNAAANDTDRYPTQRLNIRYHQMFTGAFMYAGGKHIGIEWGSTPNVFGLSPVTTDENGKKTGGNLTGWGISHEIGHVINAAGYQRAEVTNNVFAQLAKTDETNATFRTSYENVYNGVVSGSVGHTGNLAVQLAMYWQLHLAYDNDYTHKTYATAAEQQAGLFYARVDSYMRNAAKAKAATGIDLPLNSTADDNFMRACCAAAQKDLLDFFRAWGFKPNAATVAYAANFEKETRKIQYIDDNSRLYRIEGKEPMSEGTVVNAAITNAVNSRINGNRVNFTLANTNTVDGAMLGYEISRNGRVVGFVTAGKTTFTDIIATENNKAFTYTVTAYDKYLNATETVVLPEVKICHDGSIGKTGWTAESNAASADDILIEAGADGNCEDIIESGAYKAIDNDAETVFTGTTTANSAEVVINLGRSEQVTALKYTPAGEYPIGAYTIAISADGTSWEQVKTGTFTGGVETVYFNKLLENGEMDPWMYIYDANYVKITAVGQKTISIGELDILGPTNDNVELVENGFGRLSTDFVYADGVDEDGNAYVIPAGSIVFYGEYKGDPSYNVVLLKDQDGNIINGSQIILAEVAEEGYLGETSDGRWFYWLEDEADLENITSVQAELYRVQDALTLEGQRLTSTSLHLTIPATLANITITSDNANAQAFNNASENEAPAMNLAPKMMAAKAAAQDAVEADYSAPITFVPNHADNYMDFTINANVINQPIAAHFAIVAKGGFDNLIASAKTSDPNIFLASRYNVETGVLDLYMVARSYVLNGYISGRIDLVNIADDALSATFTADTVDTVARGFAPGAEGYVLGVAEKLSIREDEIHYHDWTVESVIEPTCMAGGYTVYICTGCGESKIDNSTAKRDHVFGEWTVVEAPTCTDKGIEMRECKFCGIEKTRETSAYGHIDEDGDGICDKCGNEFEEVIDCSCICHKTSGFVGFIAKILRFFWRLFGMHQVCDKCGRPLN